MKNSAGAAGSDNLSGFEGGKNASKTDPFGCGCDTHLTNPVDWRANRGPEDEFDPDDEELRETPPEVIEALGFDPKSSESEPAASRLGKKRMRPVRDRGDYEGLSHIRAEDY